MKKNDVFTFTAPNGEEVKEDYMIYPLWERNLERDIQGTFDRENGIDDDYYNSLDDEEIPDELISQAETIVGM